jgi:uncharacterized membrane protein
MRFMMRTVTAKQRMVEFVLFGFVVGVIVAWFAPWQVTVLTAWIAGGAWFLLSTWSAILRFDADQTEAVALREDPNRETARIVLLLASVASLVGTAFELFEARDREGWVKVVFVGVAVGTVVISWAIVHTLFTLRYAHAYYTPPIGGIDFKSGEGHRPDYHDFAYVAFTVGMTFQIADTDVRTSPMRRVVLRHALLSYLFGAVILAVAINVVAGLLE